MQTAIFGISNGGLNLVVNLLALMLVVLWLALIVYTYLDARRRIDDSFLVGCATLASFFPYLGTAVYAIVRPPEFLEDARERELEIRAAELRVRQLGELSCPGCKYPIELDYLRCPQCRRRLKDPCPKCAKPVDPRWSLCPYCEEALPGAERSRRKRPEGRKKEAPRKKQSASEAKGARADKGDKDSKEPKKPKPPKRSPSREPDPDPRKA